MFTQTAVSARPSCRSVHGKLKRFQDVVVPCCFSGALAPPLLRVRWKRMSVSTPKLPYPDCFYFSAAEGWLYLGDPVAAHEELDQINPAFALERDVLVLR